MRITIDKAGRIVIPKEIRERYHMHPGADLELESGSEGILLKTREKEPSLIHKQGILVHHGTDSLDINTADFVNKARERRNSDVVAEKPRE